MAATTIQQTGKRWKLIKAFGALGMLAGLALLVLGVMMRADPGSQKSDSVTIAAWSIGCFVASFPVYLMGRLGSWWFHG